MAIVDFVMFPDKAAYQSNHYLLDDETYSRDLHDFSFTFLELPKFKKSIDALENIVERWTYFFKHAEETKEQDIELVAGIDAAITRAYEELNRFSWTDIELNTYEKEEKRERDERAVLSAKLEDAKKEGKTEGLAEGLAEGLNKGMLEEQKKIAKNLLLEITDLDLIARVTHLSINEIKSLQAEPPNS